MRLRRVGLAAAALVAGGCGAPARHDSGRTTPTAAASAAPTPPLASTSTVVVPTLPPPATRAPLAVRESIALPLAAQPTSPVATEAPDGAVFAAERNGTVVWVVDGDLPAAVAEHLPAPVSSLAADNRDLYVATAEEVYGFDRASGSLAQTWALPRAARVGTSAPASLRLTAAAGSLWLVARAGRGVDVYRINPAAASPLRRVKAALGALVGPDGTLYYEGRDGHLVRQASKGATIAGPKLELKVDATGGGVPRLEALAGGEIWVERDAGQGLDASYRGYDQRTLSSGPQIMGAVGATAVDTQLGPVWQTAVDSPPCPFPASSCLLRLGSRGSLSEPFADGAAPVALGPYPAIVTSASSGGGLVLERLG